MAQDLKCLFGLHRYAEPEVNEVTNHYGEIIKKIYVCRCSHCGRLHSKTVYYEPYR